MKSICAATVLAGLILAAVFGCSSSSHITKNEDKKTNMADSVFVSSVFDAEMVLTSLQSVDISRALMQTVAGAPPVSAPASFENDVTVTSVTSYEYVNGWHIFHFEATVFGAMMADTTDIEGYDSVKVVVAGSPVAAIDDITLADELYVRAHIVWRSTAGDGQGAFHHRVGATREIEGTDTLVTLSGTTVDSMHAAWEVDDSTGNCVIDINLSQNLNALEVDINADENECPRSGSVLMAASVTLECEGDPQQGWESLSMEAAWTMLAVVNPNNTVTVTVTIDNDTYTVTEPCGESVATVPPWGILAN